MPNWQQLLFPTSAAPPGFRQGRPAPAYEPGASTSGPYTPQPVQAGWETGLDPALVAQAQQLKALAAQEGIDLAITAGHRSREEQARLYAQGRSAPGGIITYAKPGTSRHESGRAIDVVPLKDGKPDWKSPHWSRLGALGQQLGLEWGGTWKKLNDRPHFQLPTPYRGTGQAAGTPPRQAARPSAPAASRDWGQELFATSAATAVAAAPAGTIPGVETLTEAFRAKVQQVARRLRMDPQHLLTVMSFETGGTFDPAQRNQAGSGATGLIQFLPATAQSLGTSTEALAGMTPEQQLDYVERYLKPYAGRMRTQQDAYLAVLNPSAMGKPARHVLFSQGTRAYELNKALDKEGKGRVTVGDTVASVGRFTGTQGTTPKVAVPGTDWVSALFGESEAAPRDWGAALGLEGSVPSAPQASQRKIAGMLGVTNATVSRDLQPPVTHVTPPATETPNGAPTARPPVTQVTPLPPDGATVAREAARDWGQELFA